jgi:endonuclease YncB( thermonuclease family)
LRNCLFRWRVITAVLSAASLAMVARAEDRAACISTTLGTFETAGVLDARTFKLRDGREVLLAAIEVPSGRASAKTSLERLLAGGTVVLKQAEPASDRYGRLLVQAYVSRDGAERWIQEDLLVAGHAQVGIRPGSAACAKALRAAESPARRGRRGLWADSAYAIKASDDLAGLLARRGQFTVAEGKILSVRESGGTIYMNLGRVWSRNLTVTILSRNRPAFEGAGMDPKNLEGARIRVRGWVEERGGPRIEAVRPEQIEIAAQD